MEEIQKTEEQLPDSKKQREKDKRLAKTTKEEPTKEVGKAQPTITKKETVVYCGPKFKTLIPHTIYKNGLPKVAKCHFEKCPALEKLFVNVKDFPLFSKKLQDKKSIEYALYLNAEKYLKKG